MMFGGGSRRSKLGADKRTSNFPFENSTSARAVKKEEKEKRKSVTRTKSRNV